jgi:transposase-like protein
MKQKRRSPEQIVRKLREVDALLADGKTVKECCRVIEISEQTYYVWKRKYGKMQATEAKRLKELEVENERLKRIVADLSVEKEIMKEFIKGKY